MAKKVPTRADVDLGFTSETLKGPDLRGLFAASVSDDTGMQRPRMIEISKLLDNPYQPRLEMHEETLRELANIIEQQGFIGVLVVRDSPTLRGAYELTAGHRRRDAARLADLKVLPVVVQELTDHEMLIRAITENVQREDLTPLEEGRIYSLMSGELGMTYSEIAQQIGKSESYVRNRKRAAESPDDVQNLVRVKPDSLRAVVYLSKVEDAGARAEIIRLLIGGLLTVDDIPGYIEEQKAARAAGDSGVYVAVPGPGVVGAEPQRGVPVYVNGELLQNIGDVEHTHQERLSGPRGEATPVGTSSNPVPAIGESRIIGIAAETETDAALTAASMSGHNLVQPRPGKSDARAEEDVLAPAVDAPFSLSQQTRERSRVRRTKLSLAVTALIRYREFLTEADEHITAMEREQLDQLTTLIQQIRNRLQLD